MFKGGSELKQPFRASIVQFHNNCKDDFKRIYQSNKTEYVKKIIKSLDLSSELDDSADESISTKLSENVTEMLNNVVDDIYKKFTPHLENNKSYLMNQFLMKQQMLSMEHLLCNISEFDINQINDMLETDQDKLISDSNEEGDDDDDIGFEKFLKNINEQYKEQVNHPSFTMNSDDEEEEDDDDDEDNSDEKNSDKDEQSNYNDFLKRFGSNIDGDIAQLLGEQIKNNLCEQEDDKDNDDEHCDDDSCCQSNDEDEYDEDKLEIKTVVELKQIAKTLNIPQKRNGKHKKKKEFIEDILEVIKSAK